MSVVHHGALDYAELAALGLSPESVADFSSNCNPFGPPPGVEAALRALPPSALARYPDRDCLALRERLAALHALEPAWICIGNGSAELIWALARALLKPGALAAILGPTFGEYAAASAACGARVTPVEMFRLNGTTGTRAPILAPHAASVVWLCNPNNPTGHLLSPRDLAALREEFPSAIFVIDEAYLAFVPGACAARPAGRTVILRSLTKDFGMAGLRLGYLLAPPPLIARVRGLLPPWNIGAPAQAAGLAALDALEWHATTMAQIRAESERLRAALRAQGWRLHAGAAHFFLLSAGDGATLRARLLAHKLVVRDCASFGLPAWVRIAPQVPALNDRLIAALEQLP
ncbi:MAG: aminotransferase class I/II-fold pyridoxal phosphate-dependent enzyme [Ardenticatenaceae bacterium]|nr:aminotransferase class I/II-fold pyridoxal phosphate-dependent enzyme [Ardenticatenaceae bacterium]